MKIDEMISYDPTGPSSLISVKQQPADFLILYTSQYMDPGIPDALQDYNIPVKYYPGTEVYTSAINRNG